jgi:hypothetical protein
MCIKHSLDKEGSGVVGKSKELMLKRKIKNPDFFCSDLVAKHPMYCEHLARKNPGRILGIHRVLQEPVYLYNRQVYYENLKGVK